MIALIDAHVHFWCAPRRHAFALVKRVPLLDRDFMPPDLVAAARASHIRSAVLVQADRADEETDWMLTRFADEGRVGAVVGWLDFADPAASARVEALAGRPKLRGVRAMPPAGAALSGWLGSSVALSAMRALARAGLSLELTLDPEQLDMVPALRAACPELELMLSHGARPRTQAAPDPLWRAGLSRAAAAGGVHCKLSGLVERAGFAWSAAGLLPFTAEILEAFGPDRVLFASNWPVLGVAANHDAWTGAVAAHFDALGLGESARRAVFRGNAERFYRIAPGSGNGG